MSQNSTLVTPSNEVQPSNPFLKAGDRAVPRPSLLETAEFPIEVLADFAVREGRRPRPIYTAHKWFARRLGCVFRALLVGGNANPEDDLWEEYYGSADLRGLTVLDPFVGGGTSVVEAQRLGADVIGVDVDPVACAITRFELQARAVPDLLCALSELKACVGGFVSRFHRSVDDQGAERTVLHHFWVQVLACNGCGCDFEIHPSYVLAHDKKIQWVICSKCGEIAERPSGQERFKCGTCNKLTRITEGTVRFGKAKCPSCGHQEALINIGRTTRLPPTWKLFALEVLDGPDGGRPVPMTERQFVRARRRDRGLYDEASLNCAARRESHPETFPIHRIVKNQRDPRLYDYGYRLWTDLFNDRQLLHLSLLAEAIAGYEEPVRRALAIAFSDHLTTNCMMTAYAAGWRRLTPIFGIRAFRHVPRPVELNPWCDGTGRGTYPNTVRKLLNAAEFSRQPKEPLRKGGFQAVTPLESLQEPKIARGTAQDLSFLRSGSVDMVLTDPPYFDNIAYSDLAEFFLPWMEMIGLVASAEVGTRFALESLVAQRNDSQATERYTAGLSTAFREVARVLSPQGIVVFTFRHTLANAWLALAKSIAEAGLRVTQVLPAPGEAGVGPHAHSGGGLWDAVFVLRPGLRHNSRLEVNDFYERYTARLVETWADKLSETRLPLTAADRLTLKRAGLVATSLGLLGEQSPGQSQRQSPLGDSL